MIQITRILRILLLNFSVDSNAIIPNSAGKYVIPVTLTDDEGPVVSVDSTTLSVNETAGKTRVLLTLDKTSTTAIDVGFTATTESGDSAESGDYTPPASGAKVTFAAGETSKVVEIVIPTENPADSADDTFTLTLTLTTGQASFAKGTESLTSTHKITIEDETKPTIFIQKSVSVAASESTVDIPFDVSPGTLASAVTFTYM